MANKRKSDKSKPTAGATGGESRRMMTPRGDVVLVPEKKIQVKLSWGWVFVDDEKPAEKGKD